MVFVGVVSCPFLEIIFNRIATKEPANWSLLKAERRSLSEVNFSIEIIWGHLECSMSRDCLPLVGPFCMFRSSSAVLIVHPGLASHTNFSVSHKFYPLTFFYVCGAGVNIALNILQFTTVQIILAFLPFHILTNNPNQLFPKSENYTHFFTSSVICL